MSISPLEYRQRAESCERLAQTAISDATRETMLFLASRWRDLADQHDRKQKSSENKARPQPSTE